MRTVWPLMLTLLFVCPSAMAVEQEPNTAERWLLLCCGLPGDDQHRDRLTDACKKIISSSESVLGVSPARLRVLAGDEKMRDALAEHTQRVGVCSHESVSEAMQRLGEDVQADDACWVMMLGHASLYNGKSQFNVEGSDFDQHQFANWAKTLACREQVFWVTMPVSGFWIKPLSGRSRVVIAATEADLEFTGTEMPYALADILAGEEQEQALDDIDQDGSLSLLDLYLAANLEITGRFRATQRLQTEHAQLDDNGDGRGSEVQQPYLPVEEKEETAADEASDDQDEVQTASGSATVSKRPDVITSKSLDGFRSRHILIEARNSNEGSGS